MKITGLTLCDFTKLKVSRIREIVMDTSSDNIHLILGTNGCGKSSIMHELLPYPPTKTSFGKSGFKEITLHHNGTLYKLTYEPGYGHQFFCGTENLNKGTTNEIQKDLIFEHFGLNTDIHTLLKGALPICDLRPAQRKSILMGLNPINIDIFLEKYQKVHKAAVSHSNNLDRLLERQKQLMMQRIPEEQYNEMLQRKEILQNQEKTLLIWITKISSELDKYPEVVGSPSLDMGLKGKVYSMFKTLPKFDPICRSKYENQAIICNTKSEMINAELKDIETNIEDVISTLNDYEVKREILRKDEGNVEEELSNILLKLKGFSFPADFISIPEDRISSIVSMSDSVREILVNMSYLEYKEIPDKDLMNQHYRNLTYLKARIENLVTNINNFNKNYETLKKTIRIYSTDSTCKKESCDLFVSYSTHTESRTKELKDLGDRISSMKVDLEKDSVEYRRLRDEYEINTEVWKRIDQVLSLINKNRNYLRSLISNEKIIERIKESPLLLVNDINQYITESERFGEYKSLLKRTHELETINASLASKKQLSMEVLDTEILTHTKRLNSLRKKHELKSSYVKSLLDEKKLIDEFSATKRMVNDLDSSLVKLKADVSQNASRKYIVDLYNVLDRIISTIRSELVDITKISKEQEMLIVRLDKEVNNVIDELRPKLEQTRNIEKSLNDLPIEYTKSFVNNIIETTNYFINEIMTYPMYLVPVSDGEMCDFSFPIVIENDVKAKDISLCSEGQKAVIQFAFNLAMVIELKYSDYPIFCDEVDRALDTTHSKRLTDLLVSLVEKGIVGQLFIVGHHFSMINKFSNSGNITVLNGDNIVLPEVYNQNTKIAYY